MSRSVEREREELAPDYVLTPEQRDLLVRAHEGGGRVRILSEDYPEFRAAVRELDRAGLLRSSCFTLVGFSDPDGGGWHEYRLTPRGAEVARVEAAP